VSLFLWTTRTVRENQEKTNKLKEIKTFGELKKSGYKSVSIKEEIRKNLIVKLKNNDTSFRGIMGFEDTVIPDMERAILSRHNILLLGLRGQAKTRIARLMVELLDEYIPAVEGSDLNEDPFNPLTYECKAILKERGDTTPIKWIHRSERYVEKLATPDVSIADLIGDVDPIKAATLKLPYSDERVLHFGLVPRAHRSIFVLNELPDLQPRIQVSLFNILQEGDIQIRGFKLRLPLDIQFVFTANPEDYTNRGSIITPLKDRIESQILTHYPTSIEIAKGITKAESKIHEEQQQIKIFELHRDILEKIVFEARESEFVDEKSGVSARLSISAMENLVSTAERRMIINSELNTETRLSDFWGVIPAITGKLELVYEGEQEGPYQVAMNLFNLSVKSLFLDHFPNPTKKRGDRDIYGAMKAFFGDGNKISLLNDASNKDYKSTLDSVPGLSKLVESRNLGQEDNYALMELVLFGLVEFNVIEKDVMKNTLTFEDPMGDVLRSLGDN
jgi:magnesium chelatase subunit I